MPVGGNPTIVNTNQCAKLSLSLLLPSSFGLKGRLPPRGPPMFGAFGGRGTVGRGFCPTLSLSLSLSLWVHGKPNPRTLILIVSPAAISTPSVWSNCSGPGLQDARTPETKKLKDRITPHAYLTERVGSNSRNRGSESR